MSTRAPAISPSRAGDFRQCPLMFRLRVVDKVPEPPSPAATLGTLVHAVLEKLFDAVAADRTVERAHAMVEPEWQAMAASDPELQSLHATPAALAKWLDEGRERLTTYFGLENPQRLEPAGRELLMEFQLPEGPLLRGIVDRLDVAEDGSIRVIDYKTGKTPAERFRTQPTFQMRFYALLVERLRGRRPALLQLLYLRDGGAVALHPTDADLERIEAEIRDLWDDICTAARSGTFAPTTSRLCDWCSFQSLCPAYGGTPPELDGGRVWESLGVGPPR